MSVEAASTPRCLCTAAPCWIIWPRVQADDPLIRAAEPARPVRHQLRDEAAVTVPRTTSSTSPPCWRRSSGSCSCASSETATHPDARALTSQLRTRRVRRRPQRRTPPTVTVQANADMVSISQRPSVEDPATATAESASPTSVDVSGDLGPQEIRLAIVLNAAVSLPSGPVLNARVTPSGKRLKQKERTYGALLNLLSRNKCIRHIKVDDVVEAARSMNQLVQSFVTPCI